MRPYEYFQYYSLFGDWYNLNEKVAKTHLFFLETAQDLISFSKSFILAQGLAEYKEGLRNGKLIIND
jgi:hypothetical protein